jgi:HPt (histidine-containing phosphotransfer) domain-containing protein
VAALQACVREAVEAGEAGEAGEAAPEDPAVSAASAASFEAAIARHFGGDAALFEAFRAACRAQFQDDLQAGDRALAAADLPALRRLGHSLKSVLRTLGREADAERAAALDAAAAAGRADLAAAAWPPLRAALQRPD